MSAGILSARVLKQGSTEGPSAGRPGPLPQSWRLTRAVIVATFDGRFMPAIRPSINTAPRIAHNELSSVQSRSAEAAPRIDRAMVPLC